MTQFYFQELSNADKEISLCSLEEVRHITKSYRAKVEDTIQLFDGKGCIVKAKIKKISKNNIILEIIDKKFFQQKNFSLILCQGLIKIDKFELIIEKTTEIGINEIFPLKLENSIVNEEKFIRKYDRFKTIILEAAKQSNRVFLPKINNVSTLKENFNLNDDSLNIVFYKDSEKTLKDIEDKIKSFNKIKIFVGPEGDFSVKEVEFLKQQKNIYFINLGENILKSETAAIVGCALIYQLKYRN